MDGHFVPNLTWGPPVVKSLRKSLPDAYLDCHLMVTNPETWLKPLADAGTNNFTFHLEAVLAQLPEDASAEAQMAAVKGLRDQVKSLDMSCGIVIKPGTPVEALMPYVELFDMVRQTGAPALRDGESITSLPKGAGNDRRARLWGPALHGGHDA
eukprot:scaffold664_cov260-Pinguiococcus_pyrenoidosus.AAC.5